MMAFEGNSIQTFVRNFFSEGTSFADKEKTLLCIVERTELLWTFVLNQFIQSQSKFLIDLVIINYEIIKI